MNLIAKIYYYLCLFGVLIGAILLVLYPFSTELNQAIIVPLHQFVSPNKKLLVIIVVTLLSLNFFLSLYIKHIEKISFYEAFEKQNKMAVGVFFKGSAMLLLFTIVAFQ